VSVQRGDTLSEAWHSLTPNFDETANKSVSSLAEGVASLNAHPVYNSLFPAGPETKVAERLNVLPTRHSLMHHLPGDASLVGSPFGIRTFVNP